MNEKKLFLGEIALMMGLICNSLASTLMVESGFGISAISSVPYTLSLVFDNISFGVWNYIFQGSLILILIALTKKFKMEYVISFFISIVFGYMIDGFNLFVPYLSNSIILNIVYFSIGFGIQTIGMCLLLRSMTPVLPIDTFTRDLPKHFDKPYKVIKTKFDLACLITTILLSITFLKRFAGIGVGTVVCAFITGNVVAYVGQIIDNNFYFNSYITKIKNKNNKSENLNRVEYDIK
ncbi:MAG: DUF6198 family protein [Peptostreptococcaceae bacterium]